MNIVLLSSVLIFSLAILFIIPNVYAATTTHVNEKQGFSIELPLLISLEKENNSNFHSSFGHDTIPTTIEVMRFSTVTNVDKYLEVKKSLCSEKNLIENNKTCKNFRIINIEKTKVNGIDSTVAKYGFSYAYSDNYVDDFLKWTVLIPVDDKMWVHELAINTSTDKMWQDDLKETIYSFKLLNPPEYVQFDISATGTHTISIPEGAGETVNQTDKEKLDEDNLQESEQTATIKSESSKNLPKGQLVHQSMIFPDSDKHKSVTVTFENWSIKQGNGNFKEIIIEGHAESNKHNMKKGDSAGFNKSWFFLFVNDESFFVLPSPYDEIEWDWKSDTTKPRTFQMKFEVYDWITKDTPIVLYEGSLGLLKNKWMAESSGFDVDDFKVGDIRQLDYQSDFLTPSSNGGGCLIATATYGSEMAAEVQQLRELRDNTLLNTESGSVFMSTFNDIYYSFSPTIADMEREHPYFKEAVKLAITPMISTLSLMENAESESEVLGIGISVIVLNLGMYLGIPAIVIVGIRKTIF